MKVVFTPRSILRICCIDYSYTSYADETGGCQSSAYEGHSIVEYYMMCILVFWSNVLLPSSALRWRQ